MAVVKFRAMCSGTETKVSRKDATKTYQITKFVELPSMKVIEVFGDLGLKENLTPVDYELQCDVVQLQNVVVLAGGSGKNSPSK